MHAYLERTRHAWTTLIDAIFREERELAELSHAIPRAEKQVRNLNPGIEFLAMNPDLDDEGLGQLKAMEQWETSNEVHRLRTRDRDLTQAVADKEAANIALCGALLQIAKRGITGPDTKIKVRAEGRKVDELPVSEMIWGARNQSMHHEEPPKSTVAVKVFTRLKAVHGTRFDAAVGKDLSLEIVRLLGWGKAVVFMADLEVILPL
jgi:hypothetical protein